MFSTHLNNSEQNGGTVAFLTVKEVAETLHVTRASVERLIQLGELKAIKGPGIRGHVRIDEDSLASYIDRHTVTPANTDEAAS